MAARVTVLRIKKGGSGKTTTAVNLAAALALAGRRVLLLDADPQGHAGEHVGVENDKIEPALVTLLSSKIAISSAVHSTSFGFDLLPAGPELGAIDRSMSMAQVGILKPIIRALSEDYEHIICDTGPAESNLGTAMLNAGQEVLIPMQAEYLAFDGLKDTLKEIEETRLYLNEGLILLGILVTMTRKTNISEIVEERVKEKYPDLVLPVKIRDSVKLSEAPLVGKPGVIYAPNAPGAQDYLTLKRYLYDKER